MKLPTINDKGGEEREDIDYGKHNTLSTNIRTNNFCGAKNEYATIYVSFMFILGIIVKQYDKLCIIQLIHCLHHAVMITPSLYVMVWYTGMHLI